MVMSRATADRRGSGGLGRARVHAVHCSVVRFVLVITSLVALSASAQADGGALARAERLRLEGKRPGGTLPKEVIGQAINRKLGAVRQCAEEKLTRAPGSLDKVVVRFVIEENGKVTTASIEGKPPADEQYGTCLLEVVKTLEFPKPKGGSVVVSYPFIICGVGY